MTNLELQAQEEKDFQEMMVKPSAGANGALFGIFTVLTTTVGMIAIMTGAGNAGTLEDHIRTQVTSQTASVQVVVADSF